MKMPVKNDVQELNMVTKLIKQNAKTSDENFNSLFPWNQLLSAFSLSGGL